jgi:hypothetical protein
MLDIQVAESKNPIVSGSRGRSGRAIDEKLATEYASVELGKTFDGWVKPEDVNYLVRTLRWGAAKVDRGISIRVDCERDENGQIKTVPSETGKTKSPVYKVQKGGTHAGRVLVQWVTSPNRKKGGGRKAKPQAA